MRTSKNAHAVLGLLVALNVPGPPGFASAGTNGFPTDQARTAQPAALDVPAAIAKARANMSPDEAWTIVEKALRDFCAPEKAPNQNDAPPTTAKQDTAASLPLVHHRVCTRIERSGIAYNETATLMKDADVRDALPKGEMFFGASDRNGMVMSTKSALVLAHEPTYAGKNGPIRLGIWSGTGKKVGKAPDTITWGPRNVDANFTDSAWIRLSLRNPGTWDCFVYKGAPEFGTDLLLAFYMSEDVMPNVMAAYGVIWPNAKLMPVTDDAQVRKKR